MDKIYISLLLTFSFVAQTHICDADPIEIASCVRFPSGAIGSMTCDNGIECLRISLITSDSVAQDQLEALGFFDIRFVGTGEKYAIWDVFWPAARRNELCVLPDYAGYTVVTDPVEEEMRIAADSATSSISAFVWTDGLIAERAPFATIPPPDIVQPATIDGKQYWEGGVFVLPETKPSVLLENGFYDVLQKPGSVLHDYYEARWPVDLALDSLPVSIRQVRYHRKPFEYPKPWPDKMFKSQPYANQSGNFRVWLKTIPGIPETLFPLFGFAEEQSATPYGWFDRRGRYWPTTLNPDSLPSEFYSVGNSGAYPITSEIRKPPADQPTTSSNGVEFVSGSVWVKSESDTLVLNQLGFHLLYEHKNQLKSKAYRAMWPRDLDYDNLPDCITGMQPEGRVSTVE